MFTEIPPSKTRATGEQQTFKKKITVAFANPIKGRCCQPGLLLILWKF